MTSLARSFPCIHLGKNHHKDWVHGTPAMSIGYMVTPKRAKYRITIESLQKGLAMDNTKESQVDIIKVKRVTKGAGQKEQRQDTL